MKTKDFEKFFFPTKEINDLRNKYFTKLQDEIGTHNFYCCKEFNPDQRVCYRENIEEKLIEVIKKQSLTNLFLTTYQMEDIRDLVEFLLDSVVVDDALKSQNDKINVFLDKSSVLFFDRKYPCYLNTWRKNKGNTILNECLKQRKVIRSIKNYFKDEDLLKELKKDLFN